MTDHSQGPTGQGNDAPNPYSREGGAAGEQHGTESGQASGATALPPSGGSQPGASQPGGTDPYTYQPPSQPAQPYGQPSANPPYEQPYGQPSANPPYGQPSANPPYGQPSANPPYGQPSANPPYGQPSANPPYGQGADPYAQQGGQPYGQPSSNQPYGQPSANPPYGQPSANPPYEQAPGYDQSGGYGSTGYDQQAGGYGQPGYGQPGYDQSGYGVAPYQGGYGYPGYAGGTPDHPQATAALITGIIGLALSLVTVGIGGLVGIAGVILGTKAKREIDADPTRWGGRSKANAGFITGIIGLVILVLWIVGFAAIAASSR